MLRAPLRLLAVAVAFAGFLGGCMDPADLATVTRQLDVCATAPEGALCDDGNVCTYLDKCVSGTCVGLQAPDGTLCTDGEACTVNDACRSGRCTGSAIANSTGCDDGNSCTINDACQGGRCVGTAVPD